MLALVCLCVPHAGCTLAFDTSEVPFDEPGQVPPLNPDPNPAPNPDPDPDPDAIDGLGALCGINPGEFCLPESEDWPECTHAACRALGEGAVCLMNTSSLFGYCTRPCQNEGDCRGGGDFAASMRCVLDNKGEGLCLPGSQDPCKSDEGCPEGEVCKLATTIGESGLAQAAVCQTETPRGAPRGEHCNDDPRRAQGGLVKLCANDLCLDDVCVGLCDPTESPEDTCGNPNLLCRARDDLGVAGLCEDSPCSSPAECSSFNDQPPICRTGEPRQGPGQRQGACRTDNPDSEGSRPAGESCVGFNDDGDATRCASRMCVGRDPFFYCSAMCDTDEDCGPGLACTISQFEDGFGRYFLKSCEYAAGSQSRCGDGGRCEGGEVCAPFVTGDVSEDGARVRGGQAKGMCIDPIPGGVAVGTACQDNSCLAPGACVSTGGGAALCTTACFTFLDCPELNDCRPVTVLSAEEHEDGEALTLGFCVPLF